MSNEDIFAKLKESQEKLDKAGQSQMASKKAEVNQPWSPELVTYLSASVLGFTSLVLILSTILLWRSNSNGLEILKIFGTVSIIGMSAFLLINGYSNEQLTPIVGLFGAIAGYLLGKDSNPPTTPPTPPAH